MGEAELGMAPGGIGQQGGKVDAGVKSVAQQHWNDDHVDVPLGGKVIDYLVHRRGAEIQKCQPDGDIGTGSGYVGDYGRHGRR